MITAEQAREYSDISSNYFSYYIHHVITVINRKIEENCNPRYGFNGRPSCVTIVYRTFNNIEGLDSYNNWPLNINAEFVDHLSLFETMGVTPEEFMNKIKYELENKGFVVTLRSSIYKDTYSYGLFFNKKIDRDITDYIFDISW